MIKDLLLGLLVLWGLFSLILLAGDDNPTNPMSLTRFFLIKGAALVSLLACIFTGKYLSRKGKLPEVTEE